VYVDDVVDGCLAAMEKGESGQRYILGGQNSSLVEFLSLAAGIAGVARRPRRAPGSLVHAAALVLDTISKATRRRPWVSMAEARTASHSFLFDTSKAREELGLNSTPLSVGLERTVAWIHRRRSPGGVPAEDLPADG
jgi:dihydroflavonol-4-reductase